VPEGALARIEVAPSKVGVSSLDDAEAGTSIAVVLQNTPGGHVLAATGAGQSRYGRSAYASLLVLDRQSDTLSGAPARGGRESYRHPTMCGNARAVAY
jgi:hypothetical protein